MRVAVVDDEQSVRETLGKYIHLFSEESGLKMKVDTYESGDAFLENYKNVYDIIIFDIDMPGMNGMNTARMVREVDSRVTIIFITNIAQYAINGYEVDAVDYIIKPIGYYDFSLKFQKAVSKTAQRQEKDMVIETVEGVRKVCISEILYVEVLSHYLIYHVKGNAYKIRGSMKEHEAELAVYHFCRIHKSYLVNLAHVSEIRTNEVTVGTEALPVGRVYKERLMQEYMRYVRG